MTTPKLVLEIRGGCIVYAACTQNLEITIIDHDLDVSVANSMVLDDVVSHKTLNDYIENTINEEK